MQPLPLANRLAELVLQWLALKEDKGDTEYHIVKLVLENHGTIDQALRAVARQQGGDKCES